MANRREDQGVMGASRMTTCEGNPKKTANRRSFRALTLLVWTLSFAASLFAAPFCVFAQSDEGASPVEAVEAGRKALQGRTHYPWYDPATDGVRRVAVESPQEPPEPRNPNWRWPEWKGWNPNWSISEIFWTAMQVIFWGIIVAIFVGLIIMLTRVFLGRESAAAVTSDEARHIETGVVADRIEQLPFEVRRPQGDLLGEALRLYEQGNFSEAVVYYFSYLLVELDRRQVIRLTRGKTNRQYLREIRRARNQSAGLVERTMIAFEDVFFGNHALDRARFESCWNGLEEFQKQVQQTA